MRLRTVLLTLLLVLSSATTVVGAVPDARLTVSGVVVTPTTPLTGERLTVTATVANSVGSPSSVTVERVDLFAGDARLDRASGLGALSPGDSVDVPLTARFDSPGERTLTLVVTGRDESDDPVEVRRPVPVAVERSAPQVDLTSAGAVVDDVARVGVILGNPAGDPVRNLRVSFNETPGEPLVDRRSVPTLAAGATARVNLTFVPTAAGAQSLSVDVAYTTASGLEARETRTMVLPVAPFVDDVGVRVGPVPPDEGDDADVPGGLGGLLSGVGGLAGSEEPTDEAVRERATSFAVTVTNFGTATVRNVSVTPVTTNGTLARQAVPGPLTPGESETVVFDLASLRDPTTVTFTADYAVGVRDGRSTRTLEYRPPVGDVVVTDLALRPGPDGTVVLAGNAANLGRARVTGLTLTTLPTANVTPAYPGRDYFVGTVDGSDFAPFELVVRPSGDVDDVTLRLTYQEAGVVTERTVVVPFESPGEPEQTGGLLGGSAAASAGGLGGTGVGPLVLVLLVAALVVVPVALWRRGQ